MRGRVKLNLELEQVNVKDTLETQSDLKFDVFTKKMKNNSYARLNKGVDDLNQLMRKLIYEANENKRNIQRSKTLVLDTFIEEKEVIVEETSQEHKLRHRHLEHKQLIQKNAKLVLEHDGCKYLTEGQTFGEYALLQSSAERTIGITADTDGDFALIHRNDFNKYLSKIFSLSFFLLFVFESNKKKKIVHFVYQFSLFSKNI